jgi:hypothetical protein
MNMLKGSKESCSINAKNRMAEEKSDNMQDIMKNQPDYCQKYDSPSDDLECLEGVDAIRVTGSFFTDGIVTIWVFTLRFFDAPLHGIAWG